MDSYLTTGIYLFGGTVIYSGALNDLYTLDPARMKWTNLTGPETASDDWDRPSPRGYPGFAAMAGKVYVFGGVDDMGSECAMHACKMWDSSEAVFKYSISPCFHYIPLSHRAGEVTKLPYELV